MKKIILTYGLIGGTIVAAFMLITMPLFKEGTLDYHNGELLGYTSMVIALSMVFFGIKSYRDNHQNGAISFWKGVRIGILITLVASVMYALAWEYCYHNMSKDFIKTMMERSYEDMKASGKTEEQIAAYRKQAETFAPYYEMFPVRFGITLMEIFPVGALISFASAGLLRRKEFLPPQAGNA